MHQAPKRNLNVLAWGARVSWMEQRAMRFVLANDDYEDGVVARVWNAHHITQETAEREGLSTLFVRLDTGSEFALNNVLRIRKVPERAEPVPPAHLR